MTHAPPSVACYGIVARSPTLGDLATKIAAVYALLRNLEEAGVNPHHRYNFVSLGQVTAPVRDAMAAEGVIVMPSSASTAHRVRATIPGALRQLERIAAAVEPELRVMFGDQLHLLVHRQLSPKKF